MLHGLQVPGAPQIHAQLAEAAGSQMQVRVVETRRHEMSAKIDDLGVRLLQLQDRFVGTDRDYLPRTDAHCLRSRGRGLGVDIPVDEYRVWRIRAVVGSERRSE
jgi:hypothetical protein